MTLKTTYPSVKLLSKVITRHLENPFILTESTTQNWPKRKTIDVVLLGDSLILLANHKSWPKNQSFRLWVLSNSMREFLCRQAPFSKMQIGVIPRYKIFPLHTGPAREQFNLDKGCEFFIASRHNNEKNVGLALATIHELQKRFSKVTVTICGTNFRAPNSRGMAQLKKILAQYDWVTAPVIAGDLGPNWLKNLDPQRRKNAVLINLSTDYKEDFGVSVAQAQSLGTPCVLSDHGAHRDVTQALKIPLSLMADHFRASNSLQTHAIKCAFYISANWQKLWQRSSRPPTQSLENPLALSHQTLTQICRKIDKKTVALLNLYHRLEVDPRNPVARQILKDLNGSYSTR